MSKKYTTGDAQSTSLDVRISQPLDLRDVVNTYADLTDPSTWGEWDSVLRLWSLYIYAGMRVTVVADPDTSLNGIYYLNRDDFPLTSALRTLEGYWTKVGSEGSAPAEITIDNYTIKDGNEGAEPNDSPVPGLHVVRVVGGTY